MNLLKNGKRFAALLFSSFLLMTVLPCLPASAGEETKAATANATPDFVLQDLKGSNVSLGQFKGQKPVLLYFWATWCHYCQTVRPAVINFRKATPDADIEILAIDVGSGDSLAKLKRFEEADPAPYTVLYDTDSKVTRSYHVEGIPHFVLMDKTGAVKYTGNQLPSDPMSLLNSEGK
ncbi:MAG: TlpA disulfide reductase family protein [Syntrophobacteraceae bacterium]|jgi:peroxiredoxin